MLSSLLLAFLVTTPQSAQAQGQPPSGILGASACPVNPDDRDDSDLPDIMNKYASAKAIFDKSHPDDTGGYVSQKQERVEEKATPVSSLLFNLSGKTQKFQLFPGLYIITQNILTQLKSGNALIESYDPSYDSYPALKFPPSRKGDTAASADDDYLAAWADDDYKKGSLHKNNGNGLGFEAFVDNKGEHCVPAGIVKLFAQEDLAFYTVVMHKEDEDKYADSMNGGHLYDEKVRWRIFIKNNLPPPSGDAASSAAQRPNADVGTQHNGVQGQQRAVDRFQNFNNVTFQ